MDLPRLVIAGNVSGAGKTTIALGLMAALRSCGLRVQPFKCGPDYIDPAFHYYACGRSSRNIDSWLLSRNSMIDLVARAGVGVDVAVIEGLMGLYDGRSGLGPEGSTAEIAKWLRAPVLLVIDISRTAQSAGAIAMGYQEFDREVQIIGAVLNNAMGPTHLARATESVEAGAGLPVLGHVVYDPAITLPEAHPTLMPPSDREELLPRVERTRAALEATVDVDALLKAMRSAWPLPHIAGGGPFPSVSRPPSARIALLRDEAFDLYQPDNLDLLTAWGAELVPTSPLHDDALPPGVDGIYVGPGFPEVHLPALAANESFLQSLRVMAEEGVQVYGECGGLAYLTEGIVDREGMRHRLAGLIPAWCRMGDHGVRIGYALATVNKDNLIARHGRRVRGHEFYWADADLPEEQAAYHIVDPEERLEGYAQGNVLASRLRLHFGSDASLARNFVDRCTRKTGARTKSPSRTANKPS
ncbi:MAG: cobyrinate a,c-diamide synthase [Dehalococcoidales bacterium]|nr:cobyrinate a,c-diamide synthase [Dehalococcoidales bacterium]